MVGPVLNLIWHGSTGYVFAALPVRLVTRRWRVFMPEQTLTGKAQRFRRQAILTIAARGIWAVLQVVVLIQLARGLSPSSFALVTSLMVVLYVVVALNGLGVDQLIQLRRSRTPDESSLEDLYRWRLQFTYLSAIVWAVALGSSYAIQQNPLLLAALPTAVWLITEQPVTIWNGISVIEGRPADLIGSYLFRRGIVVLFLLVPASSETSITVLWSCGMSVGGIFSWLYARNRCEGWCRPLWPWGRGRPRTRELAFGFWWQQVGNQIRDLDVAALSALSAAVGGTYAFPARLVRPMNLVTQAIGTVAYPLLVRRGRGSKSELVLGVAASLVPVGLVAAVVALLAPTLPSIIGLEYASAVAPMQILCIAAVVGGSSMSLGFFLQAQDDRAIWFSGVTTLIGGVAQICIVAWAGVHWGAVGAAWGAVASQVPVAACLMAYALHSCSAAN